MLLGLGITLAFWPGIAEAAMLPKWLAIALLAPWALRPTPWTRGHGLLLLLMAWAGFSLAWTSDWRDGVQALVGLVVFFLLFDVGFGARDDRLMQGAAVGLTINGGIALGQVLGLDLGIMQAAPPAGLFGNKNFLAEASALVLVWALMTQRWCAILGLTLGVALPWSRGALLAAATGLVSLGGKRALVPAIALAVGGVALHHEGLASAERLAIWGDTAQALTLHGHGLGSFRWEFPSLGGSMDTLTSRPAHAHNDWLEVAFELGLPGVVLIGAFVGWVAVQARGPWAAMLLVGAVEMCFAFPLHNPTTLALVAYAAGRACGGAHGVGGRLGAGGGVVCPGMEECPDGRGGEACCGCAAFPAECGTSEGAGSAGAAWRYGSRGRD